MNAVPPTPEQQIEFLVNIQRLLSEGSFVATYKYALLLALADLSIEKGQDDGGVLTFTTDEIAEKIIGYYWRQCLPFGSAIASEPTVLKQNTGQTASILGVVEKAVADYQGSMVTVRERRCRALSQGTNSVLQQRIQVESVPDLNQITG